MDYQFIIISASESRKTKTFELLSQVNIKNKTVHILSASTPQNSADYLANCDLLSDTKKREICCSRSHLRALEYANLESSVEFSVILEDDANFYRDGFCDIIEGLIEKWRTDYADNYQIQMLNIGWIPTATYERYTRDDIKFNPRLELETGHELLRLGVSGLQGYIVWKRFLGDKTHIFRAPTYRLYRDEMLAYILPHFRGQIEKEHPNKEDVIVIDRVIFLMFYCPAVLFPPIIIERFNEKSMLNHNNTNNFWLPFFAGRENELQKYLTY